MALAHPYSFNDSRPAIHGPCPLSRSSWGFFCPKTHHASIPLLIIAGRGSGCSLFTCTAHSSPRTTFTACRFARPNCALTHSLKPRARQFSNTCSSPALLYLLPPPPPVCCDCLFLVGRQFPSAERQIPPLPPPPPVSVKPVTEPPQTVKHNGFRPGEWVSLSSLSIYEVLSIYRWNILTDLALSRIAY